MQPDVASVVCVRREVAPVAESPVRNIPGLVSLQACVPTPCLVGLVLCYVVAWEAVGEPVTSVVRRMVGGVVGSRA